MSEEDNAYTQQLKAFQVLQAFSIEELLGFTNNGGVWNHCPDGDIELLDYLRKFNERIHGAGPPGGPLNFCPGLFGGFEQFHEDSALYSIANLFEAKETKTLCLATHFPCGMAKKHKHTIQEVVHMAYIAHIRFCTDLQKRLNALLVMAGFPHLQLKSDRVFSFFHGAKLISGIVEENTYIFNPYKYAEHFVTS